MTQFHSTIRDNMCGLCDSSAIRCAIWAAMRGDGRIRHSGAPKGVRQWASVTATLRPPLFSSFAGARAAREPQSSRRPSSPQNLSRAMSMLRVVLCLVLATFASAFEAPGVLSRRAFARAAAAAPFAVAASAFAVSAHTRKTRPEDAQFQPPSLGAPPAPTR